MIKKGMEFNVLENDILKQFENLKKVFEEISKEELLSHRNGVDHEIILKIKKIKSLLLISIQLKKQETIKKYLNEMTRKK